MKSRLAESGPRANPRDVARLWVLENSPPERDSYVDLPTGMHLVGLCEATPSGAWAVELEELVMRPPPPPPEHDVDRWDGRWVLAHYESGSRTTFAPQTTSRGPDPVRNCCQSDRVLNEATAAFVPVFFDFDHDGSPEVYLHGYDGDDTRYFEWHHLLTFRGGAIAPYAPSAGIAITGMADVDGDGIPDLQSNYGYGLVGHTAGAPTWPTFVVHATADGAFHSDDEVARTAARAWCPNRPARVTSWRDALCTRMWSSSPGEVSARRAEIVRGCCESEACPPGEKQTNARDCAQQLAWFDRPPPFALGTASEIRDSGSLRDGMKP